MLIEATEKPIVYRWPGGSIRLELRKPVEVEDSRAFKVLEKANGQARVSNQQWLAWVRELAVITNGIKKDDQGRDEILAALDCCEELCNEGNVKAFHAEMDRLQKLIGEMQ